MGEAMIPLSAGARECTALATKTFSLKGSDTQTLETAVCAYHGCRHALAFTTPEAATAAALFASGVRHGTAVITTALAPLHHYNALARTGARLHYCDIGLEGNLHANALAAILGPENKTVCSAHFEGIRALPPALGEGVQLLEEITASLAPAAVNGVSIWSLESVMPEGTQPTGFLLTDSDEIAHLALQWRRGGYKQGTLWNYDISFPGSASELDRLTAEIALHQMRKLDILCEQRRENASRLDALLQGSRLFDLPKRREEDVLSTYPLLLTPQLYCPKEDIVVGIQSHGVETTVSRKPIYKTTAFKEEKTRLPVTEDFYKALLQLPCHHQLASDELRMIAEAVREETEKYAYRGCRF